MNIIIFSCQIFRTKCPNTPRPNSVNYFCEYENNLAQNILHEDLI